MASASMVKVYPDTQHCWTDRDVLAVTRSRLASIAGISNFETLTGAPGEVQLEQDAAVLAGAGYVAQSPGQPSCCVLQDRNVPFTSDQLDTYVEHSAVQANRLVKRRMCEVQDDVMSLVEGDSRAYECASVVEEHAGELLGSVLIIVVMVHPRYIPRVDGISKEEVRNAIEDLSLAQPETQCSARHALSASGAACIVGQAIPLVGFHWMCCLVGMAALVLPHLVAKPKPTKTNDVAEDEDKDFRPWKDVAAEFYEIGVDGPFLASDPISPRSLKTTFGISNARQRKRLMKTIARYQPESTLRMDIAILVTYDAYHWTASTDTFGQLNESHTMPIATAKAHVKNVLTYEAARKLALAGKPAELKGVKSWDSLKSCDSDVEKTDARPAVVNNRNVGNPGGVPDEATYAALLEQAE